jgi:hypothetical protein
LAETAIIIGLPLFISFQVAYPGLDHVQFLFDVFSLALQQADFLFAGYALGWYACPTAGIVAASGESASASADIRPGW